jgi:hypothetical protein
MVMVAMLKTYSGTPYHYPVAYQFITELTTFTLPESTGSKSFNFGDLLEYKFEKFYMVFFVSILYRLSIVCLFIGMLVTIAFLFKVPSPQEIGVPIEVDMALFKIIAIIVSFFGFFLAILVVRAILELYCVMFRIYENSAVVAEEFGYFRVQESSGEAQGRTK